MRTILSVSLLLLTLGSLTRAQGPVVAGIAPVMEAGGGYTYMRSTVPSEGTMAMNGVLLSGNADFNRHWGVKVEVGYSRNFDAFHTGRSADLLTYMGGPVFYVTRHRRYNIYAEALLGGARETGVNFDTSGGEVLGFVNHFAWAGGGGLQYRLTESLSLRGGVDYLRTCYFNSSVNVQGQTNLRTAVSVIYTFGRRE
jgi:opacity protein-like surface antigen